MNVALDSELFSFVSSHYAFESPFNCDVSVSFDLFVSYKKSICLCFVFNAIGRIFEFGITAYFQSPCLVFFHTHTDMSMMKSISPSLHHLPQISIHSIFLTSINLISKYPNCCIFVSKAGVYLQHTFRGDLRVQTGDVPEAGCLVGLWSWGRLAGWGHISSLNNIKSFHWDVGFRPCGCSGAFCFSIDI